MPNENGKKQGFTGFPLAPAGPQIFSSKGHEAMLIEFEAWLREKAGPQIFSLKGHEAVFIYLDGSELVVSKARLRLEIPERMEEERFSIRRDKNNKQGRNSFEFVSLEERKRAERHLRGRSQKAMPLILAGKSVREDDARKLFALASLCPYRLPQDLERVQDFLGILRLVKTGNLEKEIFERLDVKAKGSKRWERFKNKLYRTVKEKKGWGSVNRNQGVELLNTVAPDKFQLTSKMFDDLLKKAKLLVHSGHVPKRALTELGYKI